MWRFAGNEDQESIEMINKDPSQEAEEEKVLKCFVANDGELRPCEAPEEERSVEPEAILAERKIRNKKQRI